MVKVIPLKQNLHWDFSQTLPIDWHVYDWLLFEGILTYKTFYCPINDDDDDDEMITMMMLMRMTTMLMGANANHPYLFTDLCSLLPRDLHILFCWWIDVYVCEGQILHCACLVILFSFSSPWKISWSLSQPVKGTNTINYLRIISSSHLSYSYKGNNLNSIVSYTGCGIYKITPWQLTGAKAFPILLKVFLIHFPGNKT